MSSNMLSFTEPVPLGTWQSSVLISVKLLMFQGDVLFLWQGSVLINVTSILHVGILVSSGIPHEILFTHPKTVVLSRFFFPTQGCYCLLDLAEKENCDVIVENRKQRIDSEVI